MFVTTVVMLCTFSSPLCPMVDEVSTAMMMSNRSLSMLQAQDHAFSMVELVVVADVVVVVGLVVVVATVIAAVVCFVVVLPR